MTPRLAAAAWIVLLAAGAGLTAQRQDGRDSGAQPQVTFRVDINYVEVDAVVTDADGRFVRDLTSGDFQLFEDGTPQEISSFALVDLPVTRRETPAPGVGPIEPDAFTNAGGFDGRLYVVVLDDYHTLALRTERVKAAARRFVEDHLGANDLAAVVFTSGRVDASQDFTGNRRLLLDAIDRFVGRKTEVGRLEWFSVSEAAGDLQLAGSRGLDPTDFERGLEAAAAMRTVREVAAALEGIRGRRKAIVLLSEGIDYNLYDVFNARQASSVHNEVRQAIAAATRSNTAIYAVDPRGLTSVRDDIDVYELPDDTTLAIGGPLDKLLLSQVSLRTLSGETGGFASLNSNDFSAAFDGIVRDNSTYYLLGYYPTNTSRDGRLRTIEVRVGRPGVQVRARRGYVAPRGAPERELTDAVPGTSPELREALGTLLPLDGLTIRAAAAAFVGQTPKASVAVIVEIDGDRLTFAERDGRFENTLELSLVAIDRRGQIHDGARQSAEMSLRRETYQAVAQTGVRMVPRVSLDPGPYQFRVAARENGRGAIGTVTFDVDVPDFRRGSLAMSGLVLTSQQAQAMPTAEPDAMLQNALPAPPTTAREFSSADVLALFAEVYDNDLGRPHDVDIQTTLRTVDGRAIVQTSEQRSTQELSGALGGWGHHALIPLKDATPGVYVLRVEARSRLSDAAPIWRETLLTIR